MMANTVQEQTVERKPVTDWQSVCNAWCNGESSVALSARFGVTESAIRTRAQRYGWQRIDKVSVKQKSTLFAQRTLKQALKEQAPLIKAAAKAQVQECLEITRDLGRTLATEAMRRATQCEDGHASSIASMAKAGVGIWRESVGLSNSGDGANPTALNVHVVLRRDGGAMLPVSTEAPTIDV
jgi:hypothetical protein